jgi:hypothetical protein
MDQKNFPENLIKARIAETVFDQMFREGTDFDIYPLGYEHTIPILSQFRDKSENQYNKEIINKILDNFDNIPDFLMVKPDKSELYLVEIKYRNEYDAKEIQNIAQKIRERWNPVYLFLATKQRFYFDWCKDIIEHNGEMTHLKEELITHELQQKYLKLILEFEK